MFLLLYVPFKRVIDTNLIDLYRPNVLKWIDAFDIVNVALFKERLQVNLTDVLAVLEFGNAS